MLTRKKRKLLLSTTDTIIGEGTTVEGRVQSEASMRVDGKVIGEIVCLGDITVGESGIIESDIIARNVTNAGLITGNIETSGKLVITATGRVIGSIDVHSFIVFEGGYFHGSSRMEKRKQSQVESNSQPRTESRSQSQSQPQPETQSQSESQSESRSRPPDEGKTAKSKERKPTKAAG